MFTFFHRTPKIYLDCFTDISLVFNTTPIVKTVKTLPIWWKNLPKPKLYFDHDTDEFIQPRQDVGLRTCYGFTELFKKGIILESWCDYHVKTFDDGRISYLYSNGQKPENHPRNQYGDGFKDYVHLKLPSPWFFQEKTGVQFLFSAASWHLEDYDFHIPSGILRFDIQTATNINMFFHKKNKELFIPVGQPLVQIIPLSEKELIFKNHLVSTQELSKIRTPVDRYSFFGFKTISKLTNRNEQRNKSKCPFGFKKD